jgi:hypothetical protein
MSNIYGYLLASGNEKELQFHHILASKQFYLVPASKQVALRFDIWLLLYVQS